MTFSRHILMRANLTFKGEKDVEHLTVMRAAKEHVSTYGRLPGLTDEVICNLIYRGIFLARDEIKSGRDPIPSKSEGHPDYKSEYVKQ